MDSKYKIGELYKVIFRNPTDKMHHDQLLQAWSLDGLVMLLNIISPKDYKAFYDDSDICGTDCFLILTNKGTLKGIWLETINLVSPENHDNKKISAGNVTKF